MQNDTVWLLLDQMAELFQRNKSTISRRIKNILEDGELEADSFIANFATTATECLDVYALKGQPLHDSSLYDMNMFQ